VTAELTTPSAPDGPAPDETALDGPPPELRFRRRSAVLHAPAEIWHARLLVRALAERELRALYKQAILGVAWAILAPVALMVVFTVFFQRVATIDTNGVPYALFSYVGLVPWNFFAGSVSTGGLSLINQMTLVNKLNCPREVFPLASIAVNAVNSLIAAAVLLILFAINRFAPAATTPLVIFPIILLCLFTTAVTLIVSSITVYLRDVRHALPIIMQLGLFVTPVVYGMDAVPAQWQNLYSLVNPMAPIIDAMRQTVLYGNAPNWGQLGLGALTTAVVLVGGLKLFRNLEMGFADVA
jgi:ABC-2 type transport system permease protein/lipopolysaccharide transport system permease protein